jgi:universal stress protein A
MTPITKILVPTDLSENAEAALDFAWQFAGQIGASLHVVHVAQEIPYLGTPLSPGDGIATQYKKQVKASFEEHLTKVRARGIACSSSLAEGGSAAMIIRTAKHEGAGLIVMGTHGRGGVEHFLLGSVAERVVRLSPIPVMVIPTRRET